MYYGWYLAGFLWLMLFGSIGGSVYAWGFYAKEVMAELGLTAADIGAVSGMTVVFYSIGMPIAGFLLARFGCRTIMPIGTFCVAAGCAVIAIAENIWYFYIGYGLLLNGFGTLSAYLPAQTLITSWFSRYRARVLAVYSTAISVGGFAWLQIHNAIVQTWDWRAGWWIAGSVALVLAIVTPFVVRNSPEDVGQKCDGENVPAEDADTNKSLNPTRKEKPPFSWAMVWKRVRSSQFIILVLVSIVLVAPNGLVLVHGRLHLESLGLSQNHAVAVLSISALVGISGRLLSALGDVIHPKRLLMMALVAQTIGTFGFIFASSLVVAYISVGALGIGIGAGMQTITLLIGRYFGPESFSTTQGLRTFFAGGVSAVIPWAVGLSADLTGSYTIALTAEGSALIIVGIMAAILLRDNVDQETSQRSVVIAEGTPGG